MGGHAYTNQEFDLSSKVYLFLDNQKSNIEIYSHIIVPLPSLLCQQSHGIIN